MLRKIVAGYSLLQNYRTLNADPHSASHLKQNMSLRHKMLIDVIVNVITLDPKETAAAKQFWAVQTWFLANYLQKNAIEFNEKLKLGIDPSLALNKDNLIALSDSLITLLQSGDKEKINVLLKPLIDESHSTIKVAQGQSNADKPKLTIQNRDSISFTKDLITKGQTVVIMDAANAQRPGAGAYERGTFQEALTRNSDLYWKFLADFNNVLDKALKENRTSLTFTAKDRDIDVLSYQARFLELILYFIKKSIQQPDYLDQEVARSEFFNYAG